MSSMTRSGRSNVATMTENLRTNSDTNPAMSRASTYRKCVPVESIVPLNGPTVAPVSDSDHGLQRLTSRSSTRGVSSVMSPFTRSIAQR